MVELAHWISAYRFLRRVELVVVPGTGALDDFGDRPRGMPYQFFGWALTARLARTPFAFLSIGAGPITHPLSRFLMKYAVKFSTYCSYRDEFSRSYMADIGASPMNALVKPDIVFALPCPSGSSTSAKTTIGLGVMSYRGWAYDGADADAIFRRYIDNLAVIACGVLDDGNIIRILVGDNGDACAVDALLEEIRIRRGFDSELDRVIAEPMESMDDLLRQIGSTDLVIATRFHNVVGALMMNRPVISLGYAAKFIDIMTSVGLKRYCHDVESFSPDVVLRDLDELRGKWEEFSPLVDNGNQRRLEELTRQFEILIGGTAR